MERLLDNQYGTETEDVWPDARVAGATAMEGVMSRPEARTGRFRMGIRIALRAFEIAMDQADDALLWLLHGGLEKDTLRIVRGSWGGGHTDSEMPPLSAWIVRSDDGRSA